MVALNETSTIRSNKNHKSIIIRIHSKQWKCSECEVV